MSQFCTCHDSSAVVTCAKFWPDGMINFHIKVTWILAICMSSFVKWFQPYLSLWNGSKQHPSHYYVCMPCIVIVALCITTCLPLCYALVHRGICVLWLTARGWGNIWMHAGWCVWEILLLAWGGQPLRAFSIIHWLMQERRNSSVFKVELSLSRTDPTISWLKSIEITFCIIICDGIITSISISFPNDEVYWWHVSYHYPWWNPWRAISKFTDTSKQWNLLV